MCDYDHITLFLCVSGTESSVMMIEGMKEGPLFIACACPSICGIVDGYGPWLLLFKCSSTSIELRHAIRSNKSSSSNCNDDDDDDKGNNNNNSKAAATTTPKQWQTNLAANKKNESYRQKCDLFHAKVYRCRLVVFCCCEHPIHNCACLSKTFSNI